MKPLKMTTAFLALLVLSGCAGRTPAPVAVSQPQDASMSCDSIQAEMQINTGKIADLGSESSGKVAQNIAAGVAGIFIWPIWFAMDFQGAADKEAAALQDRNRYLGAIAQRTCLQS